MINIELYGLKQDIIDAWTAAFDGVVSDKFTVTIKLGSILETKTDAIVSPGNSYGYMDGSLDALYTLHFGPIIQQVLQDAIKRKPAKELLVGEAMSIETVGEEHVKYVICAPTMRVPMRLGLDSINVYLSTRAALYNLYKAKSVSFPQMGGGVGALPAKLIALQMKEAILEYFEGIKFPINWQQSVANHNKLIKEVA